MSRLTFLAVFLSAFCSASAADRKVATIQMVDDGRIDSGSVALEDSTNLVSAVADAIANSTNMQNAAAFKNFALNQRGDDAWSVSPGEFRLYYLTEEGGGYTDPDTGAFHFGSERYWVDETNSLVASVSDTTFDSRDAMATWKLYLSGKPSGEVVAPVAARRIDFGGGVFAAYHPVETAVYSDEFNSATNRIWREIKQISPQYTIRPQVGPDGRTSYVIFSAATEE